MHFAGAQGRQKVPRALASVAPFTFLLPTRRVRSQRSVVPTPLGHAIQGQLSSSVLHMGPKTRAVKRWRDQQADVS